VPETFVCEVCQGFFPRKTPPGQAEAEYLRNFTEEERAAKRSHVCDACYQEALELAHKRRGRN